MLEAVLQYANKSNVVGLLYDFVNLVSEVMETTQKVASYPPARRR